MGGLLSNLTKKSVKIDIIFENLFINKKFVFSVKPIKKLQRTNCLQWKKNICASLYFAPFCTITKYCWDVLALCHFLIVWSKKGLKIDTKPLSRTSPKSLCVLKIDWRHLGLKATRIIKTPLARKMCLQRIFPSMHDDEGGNFRFSCFCRVID